MDNILYIFGRIKSTIDSDYNLTRITLLILAGLLLDASTTAWNTLGYLSSYAWALEWSDVSLSFINIYVASLLKIPSRMNYLYVMIAISLVFTLLSYLPMFATALPSTVSLNSFNIYFLLVPIAIYIFYSLAKSGKSNRFTSIGVLIAVLAVVGYIAYSFYSANPMFPTDESVFNLYSAHLFLNGLNPYNPNLMSQAFSFYGFPLNSNSPVTPLTTGGIVQSMTYPAFSFLIFIPASIFDINVSLFILPFFALPILIVWYSAWSKKNYLYSSLLLLPIVSVIVYAYQAGSGYTDVFWASFVMLSYYVLPRAKLSGFLYGLSVSVKQFPVLAAPFLLFFLFKEFGRTRMMWWVTFAVISFLLINGYFIAIGPSYFFKAMVANELSPLIGIGYGPAQLSFLGILPINRNIFTVLLISVFLIFLVFYLLKYDQVKYLLFAFPIIIFLFNYRLFVQYLFFWLFITLIPIQDVFRYQNKQVESSSKMAINTKTRARLRKFGIVAISIIVISSGFAIFHEIQAQKENQIVINNVSIKEYNSTGYINSLTLSINVPNDIQNLSEISFRIITPGPVVNGNMLLWKENSSLMYQGMGNYVLNIVPEYPGFALSKYTSFRLIAYSGSVQGSIFHKTWNS